MANAAWRSSAGTSRPRGRRRPGRCGRRSAAGHLETLGRTRLRELWPFTAGEWYQEEIPPARRIPGWPEEVARLRAAGGGLEFVLS